MFATMSNAGCGTRWPHSLLGDWFRRELREMRLEVARIRGAGRQAGARPRECFVERMEAECRGWHLNVRPVPGVIDLSEHVEGLTRRGAIPRHPASARAP